MPITVPVTGDQISATSFGAPVANEVNRLTPLVDAGLPRELSYAEITAQKNITASTSAAAQTIVSAGAINVNGSTLIVIEFFCAQAATPAATGAQIIVTLFDGATELGTLASIVSGGSGAASAPIFATRRMTPSSGSHTYSARGWIWPNATTGILMAGTGAAAGTYNPTYMRIIKA